MILPGGYTYCQSLCYFSAGSLTNFGWLNYSNVDNVPGNSTYLKAYDGQIGTAPGVTVTNSFDLPGAGAPVVDHHNSNEA